MGGTCESITTEVHVPDLPKEADSWLLLPVPCSLLPAPGSLLPSLTLELTRHDEPRSASGVHRAMSVQQQKRQVPAYTSSICQVYV